MDEGDLDGTEERLRAALDQWPGDRPVARLVGMIDERRSRSPHENTKPPE